MKNILTHKIQGFISWLLRLPLVLRIKRRYPKAFRFFLNRFNTTNFLGLPLTLVLLVAAVNISILSELAEDTMESEGMVSFDQHFTLLLYNMRSEWLSDVFYVITQLGTRHATFIIGGAATLIFLLRRRYVAVLAFWLAMGGVGLSVQYGKTFIRRDRPQQVAYYPEDNYSFPSGHATTSMALYGLMAYFLFRHYNKNAQRRLALAAAAVLILLVGFSRIYLGVHFLSDVLAGYLLGVLWVLVGISLMEVMMQRRQGALFNIFNITRMK